MAIRLPSLRDGKRGGLQIFAMSRMETLDSENL